MNMSRASIRRLRWAALVAVLAYVCVSAVAAVILAEITLHLPRRPTVDRRLVSDAVDNLHGKLSDVTMQTRDGAIMRGWFVVPHDPNGSAVILLHGMGDNRAGTAGYAKLFLTHGYTVLLPDSREHGESGGAIATYGVLERDDIRRWTEWLKNTSGGGCVYGFGESMGAALILQSLAANAPLCAVVAESPFANFRQIAYDRASSYAGLGPWFGRTIGRLPIEFSLLYARVRYGADLTQADPERALRQSKVPVLLIHGAQDTNISSRHSRQLYEAATSHARLWIVPGAEHTGAWATVPAEFESNVLGWFSSHRALDTALQR
jgi:uncharacterized protein